jgi:pimeloyl-ACP methyl ester carboxylesterase
MQRRLLEAELAETGEPGPERRPEGSLEAVRAPALIVVGEHDLEDIHDIAVAYERELPGARSVVLPGAAHLPSLERPEEFDRLVLDFLASHRP